MSVYGFIVMAWLISYTNKVPVFQPLPFASIEACNDALKDFKSHGLGEYSCVKTGSLPESLQIK